MAETQARAETGHSLVGGRRPTWGGHRPGPPCLWQAHSVTGTPSRLWLGRAVSALLPLCYPRVPCLAEQMCCDPRWGVLGLSLAFWKIQGGPCEPPPAPTPPPPPLAVQEGAAPAESWKPSPRQGLDSSPLWVWTAGHCPGTGPALWPLDVGTGDTLVSVPPPKPAACGGGRMSREGQGRGGVRKAGAVLPVGASLARLRGRRGEGRGRGLR